MQTRKRGKPKKTGLVFLAFLLFLFSCLYFCLAPCRLDRQAEFHVDLVAGLEDDAACLRNGLAVADNLGLDRVVKLLARLQSRRVEGARVGSEWALDSVHRQLRIGGDVDRDARRAGI